MDSIKLTGAQKAALIILSIPEEVSLKMLSMMNEEEIRQISINMSDLGWVSSEVIQDVASQFDEEVSKSSVLFGNLQNAEQLLEKAVGKDRASELISEVRGSSSSKTAWEKLGKVSEDMLANYLRNEHPQITALVLSKMPAENSAKILSIFDESLSFDIINRMLNITSIKKETLDKVEKILKSEFIITLGRTLKQDSFEMMAEVFNCFDRSTELKFMKLLEGYIPDAAEKIKNLMFTFEDFIRLDTRAIRSILMSVDKVKLIVALRGAKDDVKNLFLSSMSNRAANIIKEEIEALGPVRVKEVDEAQSFIVAVAKSLMVKGEIDLLDKSSKAQYI
jgi:flagellar motor switch protein FliG